MPRIHVGHPFYGAGNLGDDLMIAGFRRAWKQWGGKWQLSCAIPFDRASQQRRFPEIAWLPWDRPAREDAIRHCDVWLGLGGPAFGNLDSSWLIEQLNQEREMCRRFGKPMFFLCVGVSNKEALNDPRATALIDVAEHIWTRDPESASYIAAQSQSSNVTAGADLAHLCLMEQPSRFPQGGQIGWVLHFDFPSLLRLDAVEQAIELLPDWEHHWLVQEIRALSGSEEDSFQKLHPVVKAGLQVCRADYDASTVEAMLERWPSCEVCLTSRFHAALIAAWRGARVAVIERDDKLRALAKLLGCTALADACDSRRIVDAIQAAQPIDQRLLEEQADITWRCCAAFFRTIGGISGRVPTSRPNAAQIGQSVHQLRESTMPGPNTCASAFGLSNAEINQFLERGFLGPFTAFTPEEMEEHRETICNQVLKTPSSFGVYRHQSRHLDCATIWKLCTAPAIANRLESIYGPDLMLWYSNLFDKAPQSEDSRGEYPWHQDLWHWKIEPMISLSVWLAITPATVENGCVELIPGTHRFEIPMVQSNDPNLSDWFGGLVADPAYYNLADKVEMVLRPGQFFLFNEGTLHHSNPNRSTERRIGLSFRVTLPSVKSDRSHPCIMYRGTDRFQINPYIAAPTSDPDAAKPSERLPKADGYTFDQPLFGFGWHLAEFADGEWFRWSGPEKDSWLDLAPLGGGEGRLQCRILHAISGTVLESLKVRVNDEPIALSWRQEGRHVVVEGDVPAPVLARQRDRVRVGIHLSQVERLSDRDPANADHRQLGIAFTRIAVMPEKPVQAETPRNPNFWKRAGAVLGRLRRSMMLSRTR